MFVTEQCVSVSVCLCVRVCVSVCMCACMSMLGGRGLMFDNKFVYANIVCHFVFAFLT